LIRIALAEFIILNYNLTTAPLPDKVQKLQSIT